MERRLGLWDGPILLVAVILLTRGSSSIIAPAIANWPDVWRMLVGQSIQTAWMFLGVYVLLRLVRKGEWREIGWKPLEDASWVPWAIAVGLLLQVATIYALIIFTQFFPQYVQPQPISFIITSNAHSIVGNMICIFCVSMMAPVMEELLFRGYIYHSIAEHRGQWVGMLVTSLLFGLAHGDLVRALPLAIVGLYLNWVSIKSGSLLGSMLMHAFWNMTLLVLLFLI